MPPFQTLADCLRYLSEFTNYERMTDFRYSRDTFNLDPVRDVLQALGNPHERYPILHVGGTKGKGSVCAFLASVLKAAGRRVGLFSKPHLLKLNERLSVDGQDVSDERFVELMNLLHPPLERQRAAGSGLTFFDLMVVLALTYFAQEQVDAAVLEVGFGGRLDSTNVVVPAVSVITSIGFDHTQFLGDTLAKIAAEKAGIIKPGVPVVSGEGASEPAEVIEQAATAANSTLLLTGRDFQLLEEPPIPARRLGTTPDGNVARSNAGRLSAKPRDVATGVHSLGARGYGIASFSQETDRHTFGVRTWRADYHELTVSLPGAHQRRNAAVAVAALEAFGETTKCPVEQRHVREGLASARLPGRIEVVSEHPTVILDVAHNPSSLQALREVLESQYAAKRVVLLIGMAGDKDLESNLREILPVASAAVFTGTGHPREAAPEKLRQLGRAVRPELDAQVEPEIPAAMERALAVAGPDGVVCVTGSFYLVGEVAAGRQRTSVA
jgi:dihydrofolate synthase/folylpolyglutamate synthase